jgi:hypothetical protein
LEAELAIYYPKQTQNWRDDKEVINGRLSHLRLFFKKSDMDDLESLLEEIS